MVKLGHFGRFTDKKITMSLMAVIHLIHIWDMWDACKPNEDPLAPWTANVPLTYTGSRTLGLVLKRDWSLCSEMAWKAPFYPGPQQGEHGVPLWGCTELCGGGLTVNGGAPGLLRLPRSANGELILEGRTKSSQRFNPAADYKLKDMNQLDSNRAVTLSL